MPNRTTDVTIRPTRAGDEPFIVALGERAFAKYSYDARATMRSIRSEEAAEAAVAELAGVRVGFVVVRIERLGRSFGPWARPAVARIDAIAVHPERQREGVGRSLLAWAEEVAITRGACTLALNTAVSNAPARRLFQAFGFQKLTHLGPLYAQGRPAVAMAKALPGAAR